MFAVGILDDQINENEFNIVADPTSTMSIKEKKEFFELTVIDMTNMKMDEAEFKGEQALLIKAQISEMIKGLHNDDLLTYRALLNNLNEAYLPEFELLGSQFKDSQVE
jgi:hypothetical protein